MKISVITVAFNAAATIADTLRSVAGQTWPHVEHIIIDGGSTDGTMDIVRQYTHVTSAISEPDKGLFDAMNKGWKKATGDVVAFLNADDIYAHDGVLAEVASAMADPSCDACYADLVYVSREHPDQLVRYWRGHAYRPGDCLKGWMPAHPTFFARQTLFERYGGFDIRYKQADFELAVRWFELHKIRARYVPKMWVRMRMGGVSNNSISYVLKANIESWRACRALGFKLTPFFVLRKMASRLPQYWQRPITSPQST